MPRGEVLTRELLIRVEKKMKLEAYDYASAITGLTGTLLILGTFGELPNILMVISTAIPTMICLFSMGPLSMNLFIRCLDPIEQRRHTFHALVNLPPTIYLLAHLKETPWQKFVC